MAIEATTSFPRLLWGQFKDWKEFAPPEAGKGAVDTRVAHRERKHTIVSVRAKTRPEVVARHLKTLIYENQNIFGTNNAGIEFYSGAIPLYNDKQEVVGYTQDFKLTNGL